MHENVSNSAGTKEKDGLVYGVLKAKIFLFPEKP